MSLTRKQNDASSDQSTLVGQSDFERLFSQHWEPICRVLYHLVGNWPEAEDLALETFLRLYQEPPKRDHNLSGWLYRVATNLGYNAIRAGKRRQNYENKAGEVILKNNDPINPERELERLQERERVRITLANMNPRSAKMLILRHSGFSYAEIAATLQVSPSSVGTMLVRAEREFEKKYKK